MDLADKLRDLAARAEKVVPSLQTEEATKNALVMPMIQALGYDVFNPLEVVPEFTADVGIKKGEKVDYAILMDGKPIILFECKTVGSDLVRLTPSQLYRYFSVTDARFGVFTDGLHYQFFSDLEASNKMDVKPFFEFNVQTMTDAAAGELKRFAKQSFNIDTILENASDLKYTKGIKRSLASEYTSPSEEFVRLFCSRVYSGKFVQSVRDQFTEITQKAFHEFVTDRINARLESALAGESGPAPVAESSEVVPDEAESVSDITTTDEEIQAFYVVKAIASKVVEPSRVHMRDTQSYCGVLLDDNNRQPICRLFLERRNKYLGLLDQNKKVTRHPIDSINDIYSFADTIQETVKRYLSDDQ